MKKIKRLLVALPLVALFIIGNLPVWADPEADKMYYEMEKAKLQAFIDQFENFSTSVKISKDGKVDLHDAPLEDSEFYVLKSDYDAAMTAINEAKNAIEAADTMPPEKVKEATQTLALQNEKLNTAFISFKGAIKQFTSTSTGPTYEEIKASLDELIKQFQDKIDNTKISGNGKTDQNGAPLNHGDEYYSPQANEEAKKAIGEAQKGLKEAAQQPPLIGREMLNTQLKKLQQAMGAFNRAKSTYTAPVPNQESCSYALVVKYYENMNRQGEVKEAQRIYKLDGEFVAKHIQGEEGLLNQVAALAKAIKNFVESQLQNGYKPYPNTYRDAAYKLLNPTDEEKKAGKITATVEMGKEVAETVKVIAYDIHHNRFVFDRLYELELRDGWRSPKDASKAFYDNSDTLRDRYLYAGYATREIAPVIIYRGAYLEQIAKNIYIKALNTYKADVVAFVVPRTIDVKTIHTFPEGTRDELIEYVPVPYEAWASLQHSSQFMNLPEIFKTRIQKVNEQGFAFREIAYYNGINPITGLVSGYDWYGFPVAGDGDYDFYARVFYDKAVAAAKGVPSGKKVDAATAPQAQIKAPAAGQAQAPVTAANTTTTTAPANTLPVTGASDSIFLFLSSAALMAVGILFSKKD